MNIVDRAGYKETTIGRLPIDWHVRSLENIANSITVGIATSTTEHYTSDGVPLIRNQNIREDFLDMSDLLKISREFDERNKNKRVYAGDVLTVRTGYPGVSCVVPEKIGYVQTFTTLITRPNHGIINSYFLSRYFNSPKGKELMLHQSAGGAQQNINAGSLKKLLIPIPPLSEQQKIAAILMAVDDKLDVINRQIEATQTLKQGLMQTLFSRGVGIQDANDRWVQHAEFKEVSSLRVPAAWGEKRLGDIAPLVRRPVEVNIDLAYPELGLRSYGKGTFHKPALPGSEVGNKRLFEIKAGDLLFSNVFAWEGAVAVAKPEDDGRFGSHRYITCRVDASQADTSFVFRFLTTPTGIAQLTLASPGGAGRNKTLGLAALANITIPLPPLEEQQRITEILDTVDAKLTSLGSKHSSYQTLKRGLMQKLLTGEWRVKVDAEPAME